MQWRAGEEFSASEGYGSGHLERFSLSLFFFSLLAAVWSMDQREAGVYNGGTGWDRRW